MKRSVLLGALICGLVLTGVATRNGGYLVLALPLMIYLLAGLLAAPAPAQLKITRRLSTDRTAVDSPVTVTLSLTNIGPPLAELSIEDVIPAGLQCSEGDWSLLTMLQPNQTATLQYTVTAPRGLHRFSEVKIQSREPLGLFGQRQVVSAPAQFMVLPQVVKIRRVAIRPPRTGIYAGLVPARQGGPGVEFFGVRQYQPGDPMRRINERASARFQRQFYVNEFEQERVVDVGLILDARRQSDAIRADESLFEYSVQATATLADAFLDGGNRVGLFIYGRSLDWTFPGYGKVQRERILRALAQAEQGSGAVFEKLDHLPTQLFPVRSQLVLVSPLLSDDVEMLIKLRARGYRLMVISPDPLSFEWEQLPENEATQLALRLARLERNLILKQLHEAEIQVIDWPVQTPFHQMAHAALRRVPFLRAGVAG